MWLNTRTRNRTATSSVQIFLPSKQSRDVLKLLDLRLHSEDSEAGKIPEGPIVL